MRLSISNFKIIVVTVLASALLLWIGYRFVGIQLGHPNPEYKTEMWLGNTARMREFLYEKLPSKTGEKTIFVVSGSNSLFSIASDVLSEKTGYKVKNYALHAGMHIDILFSQIRNKVKAGDIVVAPLEWEARDRVLINQFDYENYLHYFSQSVEPSPLVLYNIFSAVPLRRWAIGFKAYLYQPHDSVSYRNFYTDESLKYTWEHRPGNENYTHRALNEFGDINIELPITSATWKDKSIFKVPEKADSKWLEILAGWNDYFENKGAQFIVTSPILLEGNGPEIFSKNIWGNIGNLRDQMEFTKTPLYCDPVSATFSSIYRYDTAYHANAEGARLRSKELGQCLVEFINGKDVKTKKINPDLVIPEIKSRLIKQRVNFGSGNMLFQVRLRELHRINEEISGFHSKTGSYPKSSVDEGWGLPVGMNISMRDDLGVTYWSNGLSYKLIAKAPKTECAVVVANWPEMVDPVGLENADSTECSGFGYWTDEQKLR